MPNKIFDSLLEEKIDSFIRGFCNTAQQTFVDQNGKLIHPGEYGRYREACCKNFLQYFIPQNLSIEEGFIINTLDEVSTECDIIVYDKNHTPLIQSKEMQKFYPIETVSAIGEVKSKLTKTKLKEALEKLSKVKKMRQKNVTSSFLNKSADKNYDPRSNPIDVPFTFLICEKFDFDLTDLAITINNIYSKETKANYRHNLILSIQDGLVAYYSDESDDFPLMVPYPIFHKKAVKTVIHDSSVENDHIKTFASFMFMGVSKTTLIYPDITSYLMSKYSAVTFAV